MKRFFQFLLRLILSPIFFIINIFKAAFKDIPEATNQEVDGIWYVAAWVLTFPLMLGFTVIWAFFKTIYETVTDAEYRANK